MALFATLPEHILHRIRTHLAGDIAAHVALAHTCSRLRRMYQGDEHFWQFVCFTAGYGRPKLRRIGDGNQLKWGDLARLLVSHESVCEIKSCKEANACFARYYAASSRSSIDDPLPPHPSIELHQLYFYLHFAASPHGPAGSMVPSPDTHSILWTHLPTYQESKSSQYGPLCLHPNASCAFATFPPMKSLAFDDGYGATLLSVENPDGCTILDVNRAFGELIPRVPEQIEIALEHYRDLQLHTGLSSQEFIDFIRRDRGFLGDHEYPFLSELLTEA